MYGSVIAKNAVYQTLAKIATSGLGLIVTLLIAKAFGDAGYGDFAKITSFVTFFYLAVDFSLNAIFLQKERDSRSFRSLVTLRLLLSLGIIIFVNSVVLFLPQSARLDVGFPPYLWPSILLFSLTIVLQGVLFSANAVFQERLSYRSLLWVSIIGSGVTLFVTLLCFLFSLPLFYIFLAYVFGNAIAAVVALLLSREKLFPLVWDSTFIRSLLAESLPLGLTLLFNLVYFRIDIILLSFFRSSAEVGQYGYAYRYFDFLIAVPLFLSNAIYPLLLKHVKNPGTFHALVSRYVGVFLLVSLLLLVPAWFFAPLLSYVVGGFTQSVLLFRLLLFSLPFFFLTSILQWVLISQKQQRYLFIVYGTSALINILLNLYWIPLKGASAAAVITGVSESVVLLLLYIRYRVVKTGSSTHH